MEVPVELSRILITETGDQQVIFLREKEGRRSFPILIGIAEALAIDRRLKHRPTPRPMTHDLLASVVDALGAELDRIVISDLRDHTFIATLYLNRGGEIIPVDSRPSDAIALGVAMETPIYVADHVLDNVTHEPSTPEERLELLRKRRDLLGEKIEELSNILDNEEFLDQAPENMVQQYRRQLDEMKNEYEAIDRILRKMG